LLENPLLKILLLEEERSDMVKPVLDEREKCDEFHTLFSMLLEDAPVFFFSILEWGVTRSGTPYIILRHVSINKVILGNIFLQKNGSL